MPETNEPILKPLYYLRAPFEGDTNLNKTSGVLLHVRTVSSARHVGFLLCRAVIFVQSSLLIYYSFYPWSSSTIPSYIIIRKRNQSVASEVIVFLLTLCLLCNGTVVTDPSWLSQRNNISPNSLILS